MWKNTKLLAVCGWIFFSVPGFVQAQAVSESVQGTLVVYFAHSDSVLKAETHELYGSFDYGTATLKWHVNLNHLKFNEKKVTEFIHSLEDSIITYTGELVTSYVDPNDSSPKTYQMEGNIAWDMHTLFSEGTATFSHISNSAYYYGVLSSQLHLKTSDIGIGTLYPASGELIHVQVTFGVTTNR